MSFLYIYVLHMQMFQVILSQCTRLKKLDLTGLRIVTYEQYNQINDLIQNNPGITWLGAPIFV